MEDDGNVRGTVISITVRNQVTDEFARITPSPWDTTGARQQVSCHAYYATLKDPWNIELWRPTVGKPRQSQRLVTRHEEGSK